MSSLRARSSPARALPKHECQIAPRLGSHHPSIEDITEGSNDILRGTLEWDKGRRPGWTYRERQGWPVERDALDDAVNPSRER